MITATYRGLVLFVLAAIGLELVVQLQGEEDKPAQAAAGPPMLRTSVGNVTIFPADNPWNQDISHLPVHPHSREYLASIGLDKPLHSDFGTSYQGVPNGIPYCLADPRQSPSTVKFDYAEESDPGPYPIPADPPIEGGPGGQGDRHVLIIDVQQHRLYELFHLVREGSGWHAGGGAIFDLSSNKLRPAGWTSADAAGLPIFPGLVRYDEVVETGEIRHALRFTAPKTQRAYIHPARHWASHSNDPALPPMGLRVRLRADFDVSSFPREVQVILRAMKTYGMLLADNGTSWFVSGVPDSRWNDDRLHALSRVRGRDLEAVDTGPLVKGR